MDICLRICRKNSINAVTGSVGIFLSPCAINSQNSKARIQTRMIMMCASFNGDPCTTVISYYSPINASDEMDIITFYKELSSLIGYIPKHNILIIHGNMNAQIDKDGNNRFCLHNLSNRNIEQIFYLRTG